MKAVIKITARMLRDIREDLRRSHAFSYERVGFLTSGLAHLNDGELLLLAREYHPVDDEDYVRNPAVGAMIGPDAMRKGLQAAYKTNSALLHLHTHGGRGRPEFSVVDLKDGQQFVPSFFNVIPHMPHGLLVLSNDSARGLLWTAPNRAPAYVAGFVQVGAPFLRFGGRQ